MVYHKFLCEACGLKAPKGQFGYLDIADEEGQIKRVYLCAEHKLLMMKVPADKQWSMLLRWQEEWAERDALLLAGED